MYFFISSSSNGSFKSIDTNYNSFCTQKCLKEISDRKLQCTCGENIPIFEWTWSEKDITDTAKLSNDNKEVLFHPVYSSGTAAVRGGVSFEQNAHHYWEIKMISNSYGTDVMIGVGTLEVHIKDWIYTFCSLLGIDSCSWGYSYTGHIQHNKLRLKYGTGFGLGSIIGVHLDLCKGTLEYYMNRKPLGIAFRGLKGVELYPMVTSTAAQSAVKITCAVSEKQTLQMICLQYIVKHPYLNKQYRQIPGLTRLYDRQYFWIVPRNEHDEKKRLAKLEEDVTLSLIDPTYLSKNKRFKPVKCFPSGMDNFSDDSNSVDDAASHNSEDNLYGDFD